MTHHVIPVNDLREHEDEDCWCGPTPSWRGRRGWVWTHHSLDGREHHESDHDRAACPLCSADRK